MFSHYSVLPAASSNLDPTTQQDFYRSPRPFTPQTPSPLQTSRNALNLMSNPINWAKNPFSNEFVNEYSGGRNQINGVEDEQQTYHQHGLMTPSRTMRAENQSYHDENQIPHQQHSLITPPDTTASKAPSRQSAHPTSEFWSSRARSSSPAALLSKHAEEGRQRRKSAFLDRIRRKRDDARSEVQGDQVLRLDFVREQRLWEEEMARRAYVDGGVGEDAEEAEEEMSPTEDREIAELVDAYFSGEGVEEIGDKDGDDEMDDFDMDLEGDEYDQLFVEISERQVGEIVPDSNRQESLRHSNGFLQTQDYCLSFGSESRSLANSNADPTSNQLHVQPPSSGMDMS